jgi:hypothetical protein
VPELVYFFWLHNWASGHMNPLDEGEGGYVRRTEMHLAQSDDMCSDDLEVPRTLTEPLSGSLYQIRDLLYALRLLQPFKTHFLEAETSRFVPITAVQTLGSFGSNPLEV